MREAVPRSVWGCAPSFNHCPQAGSCLRVAIAQVGRRLVVDLSTTDPRPQGCAMFIDRRGAALLQAQGRAA